MYNIIEYGTNKILASFIGVHWKGNATLNAWCSANGYLVHHVVNRRNFIVIQ